MSYVSYAQNSEDIMLWRALSDVEGGCYVDVGAQDPVTDSVTKFFYERGWRGINVEPVAHWFTRLQADRSEDVNLRLLVGTREADKTIYEVVGTGLSTTDERLADGYRADGREVVPHRVATRKLDSILAEHVSGPIHFLKIDVEGAERDVLDSLDLAVYRPWILVIEATAPNSSVECHEEWEQGVLACGYRFVYWDGLNRFYLAEEQQDRSAAFSTPPNVFDGFVDSRIVEAMQKLAEVRALQPPPVEHDCDQLRAIGSVAPKVLHGHKSRQLFVDVTMLASSERAVGTQQVVRSILRQLLLSSPVDYEVCPVRFVAGIGYLHATQFAACFMGRETATEDQPISTYPDDILLGLEQNAELLPPYAAYFKRLQEVGVRLWFVIYDMLPVLRPECFPASRRRIFQDWYQVVGEVATGALCISRSVADEFKHWLDQIQPVRSAPLQLGFFHPGAEAFDGDVAGRPRTRVDTDEPVFLVVGTVESKQGHTQILAAFEQLWKQGSQARLLVLGKPGWLAEDIVARLRNHQKAGAPLEWNDAPSDADLMEAYASASALIVASEGEGFSFPLVEAARHRLPIIARDLPVFREVAGSGAFYFDGLESASLAARLQEWWSLSGAELEPKPAEVQWIGWEESAEQLWEVIRHGGQGRWRQGGMFEISAVDPRVATIIGRLERARLVSDGRAGYLVYGPYSTIRKGNYDVTFMLERLSEGVSAGIAELVAFDDCEIIHRVDLSTCGTAAGELRIEFPLRLDRDLEQFQVRVHVPEHDPVAFIGCRLVPRPLSDVYSRAVVAESGQATARRQLAETQLQLVEARSKVRLQQTEIGRLELLALTTQEHAAKLVEALRSVQEQRRQLAQDREILLVRNHQIETSRSWKLTRPLRAANEVARSVRSVSMAVARAIWHRAVQSPILVRSALILASPMPPLAGRLQRSIAAHAETAARSARHEGPRPPIVIGPEATSALDNLERARERSLGRHE